MQNLQLQRHGFSRRVILKASALVTAITATPRWLKAEAAEPDIPGTYAARWVEADQRGDVFVASDSDIFTVVTDFPFGAVGAHWSGEVGSWPIVELRYSADGENWSDTFFLSASEDDGRPTRKGRIFTDLLFADSASYIAYRVIDQDGTSVQVDEFALTYIDASEGPSADDVAMVSVSTDDPGVPPAIISRQGWGADEDLRFSGGVEIWPPLYATVKHAGSCAGDALNLLLPRHRKRLGRHWIQLPG